MADARQIPAIQSSQTCTTWGRRLWRHRIVLSVQSARVEHQQILIYLWKLPIVFTTRSSVRPVGVPIPVTLHSVIRQHITPSSSPLLCLRDKESKQSSKNYYPQCRITALVYSVRCSLRTVSMLIMMYIARQSVSVQFFSDMHRIHAKIHTGCLLDENLYIQRKQRNSGLMEALSFRI